MAGPAVSAADAATMVNLAGTLETAEDWARDHLEDLFHRAWAVCHPQPTSVETSAEWDWYEHRAVFGSLLRAGAYLDAAKKLVPSGHWYSFGREAGRPWARCYDVTALYDAPEEYGQPVEAPTDGQALAAACLRANAHRAKEKPQP